MSAIYRLSFENGIVPSGITIVSGSIWLGAGRFGNNTSALVADAQSGTYQAQIVAPLPQSGSSVRGSFYTRAASGLVYPATLVSFGDVDLVMETSNSMAIKVTGSTMVAQEVTVIENNRWNLVRFLIDLGPTATASMEFNSLRTSWSGDSISAQDANVVLYSLQGNIASLDDIAINDASGSIDNGVPNAVLGMVGGLRANGTTQNWQQNVASLFPKSYIREDQGNFIYVPSTGEMMCSTVNRDGTSTANRFAVIEPNANSESYSNTTTIDPVNGLVYSPFNDRVYVIGGSSNWQFLTFNPATKTPSAVTTFTGTYTPYTYFKTLKSLYVDKTSKIISLVVLNDPYTVDNSAKLIRFIEHDPSTLVTTVTSNAYATFNENNTNNLNFQADLVYCPSNEKIYAFCQRFDSSALIKIDPQTMLVESYINVGTNKTGSLCYSTINDKIYLGLKPDVSPFGSGTIYQIDPQTDVATSISIAGGIRPVRKMVYSPARNAIYVLTEVESFIFDPLTNTRIETLAIFNAFDGGYCHANAAVLYANEEKVFSMQGSLSRGVVNALLNPDSLRAGATASGDICNITIAKPTGSFFSGFTYEGLNVQVNNATSNNTASLIIGVRDSNTNIQLGTTASTWNTSTGSHVRSIYTKENSGSAKWTSAEFNAIQFYMEAGPETGT
jgi:hypothetical protein